MIAIPQLSDLAARLREEFRRGDSPWADSHFDALARELFAAQFEFNPVLQRVARVAGKTPERIAHWTEIPTLPTRAFKEFAVTCLPEMHRPREFWSSGTTQRDRSRHFHDAESLHLYECSLVPWFQKHLLPAWGATPEFADVIALTPSPEAAPNSSLVHMFGTVLREFARERDGFFARIDADGAWQLELERLLPRLKTLTTAGRPVLLLGTAFSFVHLTEALEAAGRKLTLPTGSAALETGGYKGRSRELPKAELLRVITRWLGIGARGIVSEYGMSELSSQAYDHVAGDEAPRVFRFPPWCRARVISPETGREVAVGECGLLHLHDLANVWSVMGIQTEDLARRGEDGFELIGRATAAPARGCSLMPTP